jgi:selenium-binding protein 1
MSRSPRRLLALLALGFAASLASAETCLSPFVRRLDRQEKYLYLFCVDADAKDNDFLAVIDVDPASPTYSKITYTLDLGTKGNETHHWGYTDDRTRIWAGGLFSSRIWILDVATDPARPRIEKILDDIPATTGLSGPHTYYALPGRMLLSFLGSAEGGTPAGLAEFTNDGRFLRRIDNPAESPYGYDVAVKPERNRMVTSSFTPMRNYEKPLSEMDMKDFGDEMVVWDFKRREPLQVGHAGLAPLEVRWSLRPENDYGFTNCALADSLWMFRGGEGGEYEFKEVAKTGPLPADLRQSPDDRFLFVSCFGADIIQQWDVSDPDHPRLFSTAKVGNQPNMMHVTSDGKRMYVSNSLLSTLDRAHDDFWVRLIRIGPDGMAVDEKFRVDLNGFPTGPARGHDMLIN